MSEEAKPKIKIVCPYCGSDNVARDAAARWNTETQRWEITSLMDSGGCDGCDSELKSFDEEPI